MVCPLEMQRVDCDLVDLDQPLAENPNICDDNVCSGCGCLIKDQFVYRVMDSSYHEQCLRCSCCQISLSSSEKCFTRYGSIYCEHDHQLLYGKRCRRCMSFLQPSDFVHRVHFAYYHTHCFSCFACQNTLHLGDEFHFLEGEVFCKKDHLSTCHFDEDSDSLLQDSMKIDSNRKTPKRPRTILNAQQRRQFKNAFEKSSKPSRKIREQLANETGLSVRVVQVWFQNQRAKIKKTSKKDVDYSVESMKKGQSIDGRNTEDSKSSDDDESIINMDTDNIELQETYSNPIQKLLNMTASDVYFPFQS